MDAELSIEGGGGAFITKYTFLDTRRLLGIYWIIYDTTSTVSQVFQQFGIPKGGEG